MKISLILGHPNPKSFNHAIAERCLNTCNKLGHQVFFHDLYAENFDPNLSSKEIEKNAGIPPGIKSYCDEIAKSDSIIVVHPNWWGQPPAILKGWIDRVLLPGLAYEFLEGDNGEGIPRGLLKAQTAFIFNTSNTNAEREETVFGDPLDRLWKNCIFQFCGVEKIYRKMFSIICVSTESQRKIWLEHIENTLKSHL